MGSAGTHLSHDDLGILERLALALSPSSQVRPAGRTTAAHDALCTDAFDLILLYCRLPNLHHQGASVLQAFKYPFPATLVMLVPWLPRRWRSPPPPPPHWPMSCLADREEVMLDITTAQSCNQSVTNQPRPDATYGGQSHGSSKAECLGE
jgi:hypothetical protein